MSGVLQAFKLAWLKANKATKDKLLVFATTWASRTAFMKSQWQPLIQWSCNSKRNEVDDLQLLMSGLTVEEQNADGEQGTQAYADGHAQQAPSSQQTLHCRVVVGIKAQWHTVAVRPGEPKILGLQMPAGDQKENAPLPSAQPGKLLAPPPPPIASHPDYRPVTPPWILDQREANIKAASAAAVPPWITDQQQVSPGSMQLS